MLNESGDIIIYSVLERSIFLVKGVQRFTMGEDASDQMWVNDEGTVLLIKVQDFIWMWTRSKE